MIIKTACLTFKSESHCVYTEEISKIALSNNDNKR